MMKMGRKLLAMLCLALIACMAAQVALPTSFAVVTAAQAASKAKMNKSTATIYNGQTLQLSVTGTKDKATWSTSDKKVAKVSKSGLVTAKGVGTATITAKVGKKDYTCKVTVKAALTSKTSSVSMKVGDAKSVNVRYYSDGKVTIKSSNKRVVAGEWAGEWKKNKNTLILTAKKAGTATITIKDSKSKESIKINVTVIEAKPTPEPTPTPIPTPKPTPVPLSLSVEKAELVLGKDTTITVKYEDPWELTSITSNKNIFTTSWGNSSHHSTKLTLKPVAVGTATLTVKDESTGEQVTMPVSVRDPSFTLILPETPITVSDYSFKGPINTTCNITGISYSTRSFSDEFWCYVYFSGKKTYDSDGTASSKSCWIGWKLYDANGSVVKSGHAISPSLATGESWSESSCDAFISGLPAGIYRLEVLDVR